MSIYSWVWGLRLGYVRPMNGNILKENCLSFSQQLPATNSSRGRTTCLPPLSMLGFGNTWTFLGLLHVVITAVSSYVQLPSYIWRTLSPCHDFWLLQYFYPLLCTEPWASEGEHPIEMFHLGLSILQSLILCSLSTWWSVSIIIYCKEKLLCREGWMMSSSRNIKISH